MSIKREFYKRLTAVVFISILVITVVVIRIQRTILIEDLKDKGESISRVLSSVVLDAILTHDYAGLERFVSDIEKDRYIKAIAVVRTDGEVLAGGPTSGDGLVFEYPVSIAGQKLGTVRILLSTERVKTISRYIVLFAVLLIPGLHITGVLITNILLNRTVIKPAERLKEGIGRIKEGHFSEVIDIERPDEFREIAGSFNEMALALRQSFSEIRDSAEKLAIERAKLSAIVENIADGLFVTDRDGRIITFNRAATVITGYPQEEVLNRACDEVFQTDLCRDACALYSGERTMTNVETEMITRDGRRIIVSVSSAVLYGKDGRAVGGVQTFRDITEQKRRHEMLCQTEKLAAIGQLAAGVAHEINNPLGNIMGYAKLLKDESLSDEASRWVDIIIEQTNRCSAIVKGLLDYSRQPDSEPSLIYINDLIKGVIEVVRYQAEKADISIETEFTELPPVYINKKQFEQVVLNLVLNAIQAIGERGLIRIRTFAEKEYVCMAVTDSGPGVPEELRTKVFDPFFTTKPVGQGTGLGLSICLGIVSSCNGTIEITGQEGQGATFIVRLPASEDNDE